MNILFLKDNNDPIALTEINHTLFMQGNIQAAQTIPDVKLIFAIQNEESQKQHLNHRIRLLAPDSQCVHINEKTKGSACTALMAIEYINTQDPLLILNNDEMIKTYYLEIVQDFQKKEYDAGAIVFNSIHTSCSFLKIDREIGFVVEMAEKNSISKHVTAGLYYFRQGSDFVKAAQLMIKKRPSIHGNFYIGPVFNELILNQAKILVFTMDENQYIAFNSEANVNPFNAFLEAQ
jgi:dTDP-glucose pyrophosphorylase